LVGPNGSGKTTLLNIILGVLTSHSGTIKIFGEDIENIKIIEHVNFASGEERFHWALTVYDTLDFFARVYNLRKLERKRRIGELIKFFGLTKVADRRFDALSTGERMRLAFAKALLNNPQLILLDEPTLGLDPDISRKIRKEIKRLNKLYKTTIFLTSHYMTEIEQLADRVAFIKNGRIRKVMSIKDVTRKSSLEDYFVKELGES
jgi:ABC-2 type transport system ATP-binding protein